MRIIILALTLLVTFSCGKNSQNAPTNADTRGYSLITNKDFEGQLINTGECLDGHELYTVSMNQGNNKLNNINEEEYYSFNMFIYLLKDNTYQLDFLIFKNKSGIAIETETITIKGSYKLDSRDGVDGIVLMEEDEEFLVMLKPKDSAEDYLRFDSLIKSHPKLNGKWGSFDGKELKFATYFKNGYSPTNTNNTCD